MAAWCTELLDDLGGIEAVSTQELALVEEAVKTKLILDSVDAWLLSQKTLINKRNRRRAARGAGPSGVGEHVARPAERPGS